MTVRINLLPQTYQPPKKIEGWQWAAVGAGILAVIGTGAYYGSVYTGTLALESSTRTAQGQLQVVKAGLAKAADLQVRETKVTQAETDLKSLMGRHWSSVLLDLRASTPQHITWTSLDVKGNQIVLKGTSRGLIDVAQLFGTLVDNKDVEQAWLKYANEQGVTITIAAKPDPQAQGQNAAQGQAPTQGQPQTQGGAQPQSVVIPAGVVRQLEFEMDITLVKPEGGQMPNGA
ncbi:MAG: PilN domain-containing protein [Mycobacterium leprae]